jgi:hypothetical protein
MTRAHLSKSIADLETIYKCSLDDSCALRQVLHELEYRRTKRATALRGRVSRRLEQLSINPLSQPLLPVVVVRNAPQAATALDVTNRQWNPVPTPLLTEWEPSPAPNSIPAIDRAKGICPARVIHKKELLRKEATKRSGVWAWAILFVVISGLAYLRSSAPTSRATASFGGANSYRASVGRSARAFYGGGRHTHSHGGYYVGGVGSSHRGGTYVNPFGGHSYGRHR